MTAEVPRYLLNPQVARIDVQSTMSAVPGDLLHLLELLTASSVDIKRQQGLSAVVASTTTLVAVQSMDVMASMIAGALLVLLELRVAVSRR